MRQESSSKPKSKLSKKVKVGILLGGTSSERAVSLRSGHAVADALNEAGYQTCMIDPKQRKTLISKLKSTDVAFVTLHGKGGEDGQIQSLLSRLRIPYIGSERKGCLLSFDKILTKRCLIQNAVPTAPYTVLKKKDWKRKWTRLKAPLFIKPSREGSSIGAFSVEDLCKSAVKLEKEILRYGVLIAEKKIIGREFTVGILNDRALPVIELRPKRQFYDYKAKYTKGLTEYVVPAPITETLRKRLQSIALKVHRALGLRDLSRVDVMVDQKGRPYVLEANAIPGFTALSLFPKAARQAGISFPELCDLLVQSALTRKKS